MTSGGILAKKLTLPSAPVASVFFDLDKSELLEEMLLNASREGDTERLNALLHRYQIDATSSFDLNVRDQRGSGNTALHWAAKRGHGQVAHVLLQFGVDATLKNFDGQTAIDLGSTAIRRMILESLDKPPSTSFSYRALLQAAWQGNAANVRRLIRQGPRPLDITFVNGDRLTALLLATRDLVPFERLMEQIKFDFIPLEVIRELVNHGYDVSAQDPAGKSALHFASSTPAKASLKVVELLLDKGASMSLQNSCGYTAVHCAARCGNIPVLRMLIDRGASVTDHGSAGSTPLHLSAMEGREGAVDVLLKAGADPRAVDDGGHTAIDLAKTRRIKFIIEGKAPPLVQNAPPFHRRESSSLTRCSIPSTKKESLIQVPPRLTRALSFANLKEIQSRNLDRCQRSPSDSQIMSSRSPFSPSIPAIRHGRVDLSYFKNFRETSVLDIDRYTPSLSGSRPDSGSISSRSANQFLSKSSPIVSSKGLLPIVSNNLGRSFSRDSSLSGSSSNIFIRRGRPVVDLPPQESPASSSEFTNDTCADILFKGRTSSKTFVEDIEDLPSGVVPSYPATPFLPSDELNTILEANEEISMSLRTASIRSIQGNPLEETSIYIPPEAVIPTEQGRQNDSKLGIMKVQLDDDGNNTISTPENTPKAQEDKHQEEAPTPVPQIRVNSGIVKTKVVPISKTKMTKATVKGKGPTTAMLQTKVSSAIKTEKDRILVHKDIDTIMEIDPTNSENKTEAPQIVKEREKSNLQANQSRQTSLKSTTPSASQSDISKTRPKPIPSAKGVRSKSFVSGVTNATQSKTTSSAKAKSTSKPRVTAKRKISVPKKNPKKTETVSDLPPLQTEPTDVATYRVFISGQGWHLATPCNEPLDLPVIPPPVSNHFKVLEEIKSSVESKMEVIHEKNDPSEFANMYEALNDGSKVPVNLDVTERAIEEFKRVTEDSLDYLLAGRRPSESSTLVGSDEEIPEELESGSSDDSISTNPDFMRRIEASNITELSQKMDNLRNTKADLEPRPEFNGNSWSSQDDDDVFLRSGEQPKEGRQLVPNWRRGNMLGRGSYGMVWCGMTDNGQLIAVKEIKFDSQAEEAKAEFRKIQEEIDILKGLKHSNIVQYLGTNMTDESVFIFMEFVPGGSLASLLARFGAFAERVFRRYTRHIVDGVRFLHSNSVIHRDIKGANVMLMPDGIVKLIDFGCAKRLEKMGLSHSGSLQQQKSIQGSPYWMAPEVILETGHGKKSDVWSIGCTVFEMATSKPPWGHLPRYAAVFAIGSGDGETPTLSPDNVSEEARDFVSRCMVRDAPSRPTAEELLEHPFIRTRRSSSIK